MKYATLTIMITSAIAIATLNFSDPMNEAPLLFLSCISNVSKVNVEWSDRDAGLVSGLLRGCGCSGLASAGRMGSLVDGAFAAGTGACVAGDFAAGADACVAADFAAGTGACVAGDFAAGTGAFVEGAFAAGTGACVAGAFAAGTWT